MDLVSAMQARHSVRKYTDQALEPGQAQLLEARMEEINQREGLNFRLILGEDQFFQRRIPSFGNFENVKNYFVLAGKKDLDPQKVGYWGEDLVLYAQSLGLNTCWVGFAKFFYKDLVLEPGEKVFCLISLGYGQDQGKSRPSKSLEDVARGPEPYPEWFIQGVQGALLAPTAMNQQKFTIHYHPHGKVDFKAGRGFFAKLDLGIVKYHFDLVTKDRGVSREMKKCLVLVNPASGDGKSMESIPKLEKRLEEDFDQVEIIETKEEGQGARLAQKACREKVHSLFVIGGDGTIHEIVNGLAEEDHRPILGLLPGGTNNTYYRLIGENRDLDAAIDDIDLKTTKEVDLGQCNDRFFIYYTCFGRLIDATTSTDGEEKERLGPLAYVKNIFKALPEDETYQIKLISDGGNYQGPASHVYAFLVDQVGNLNFSEISSSLSSGQLYVFILTNAKVASKLAALKDMVMGQLDKNEDIQAITCSQLSIEELKGESVDLDMDGEMEAKLPAQIRILPKHIRVYLPKEKE